jgi:hypothetical protein
MSTITVTLVRSSDGSVDVAGTLSACEAQVERFIAERELEEGAIAAAVHAQFDKYPGAFQNSSFLVGGVLTALNATHANHGTLSAKVEEWLSANTNDAKAGEPVGARLFTTKRGKGGGTARVADLSSEQLAKLTKAE